MNEFLIDKLASLFSPQTVSKLDGDVVTKVAGESEQSDGPDEADDGPLATTKNDPRVEVASDED